MKARQMTASLILHAVKGKCRIVFYGMLVTWRHRHGTHIVGVISLS